MWIRSRGSLHDASPYNFDGLRHRDFRSQIRRVESLLLMISDTKVLLLDYLSLPIDGSHSDQLLLLVADRKLRGFFRDDLRPLRDVLTLETGGNRSELASGRLEEIIALRINVSWLFFGFGMQREGLRVVAAWIYMQLR